MPNQCKQSQGGEWGLDCSFCRFPDSSDLFACQHWITVVVPLQASGWVVISVGGPLYDFPFIANKLR